ncbi:MAG TPA: presqualene diphosphate synthase HpnD [Solirubrobacterales bacterium]|nr:presqualene diphosphate synthase HpnD [Solirubrobacterales bacterium]
METREAYRICERVTRKAAANFFYGIRLLPADKRRAMSAVYAYARRVDDIGDGTLPAERKLADLAATRRSLLEGDPNDAVMVALSDARTRFRLPHEALTDLLDGVQMDVVGTHYERFDELVVYCRAVAGSIGRLCVGIFGASDMDRAVPLADDLGVAMQITNVLRDVREDYGRGRVYLPAEDLQRFACAENLEESPPDASAALIRFEAARGREWFARGLGLLPLLDARSRACVRAMTGIYRRILSQIERDPQQIMRRRVSLPAWEKAWVAARSLAGAGA